MCTGCCHAPAFHKCCCVRASSRLLWVCPGPEWSAPPTQRLVPHCRCLHWQTTTGNSLVLCLFSVIFSVRWYLSMSSLSLCQHTELSASRVSWCLCRGCCSSGWTFRCSDRHWWERTPLCLVNKIETVRQRFNLHAMLIVNSKQKVLGSNVDCRPSCSGFSSGCFAYIF